MLENVRFNKGEKKGDKGFAQQLAGLADVYVNDAFGTCHRDEASMVAVPERFPPEDRAIGFLVEKELQILDTLLGHPKPPMVAVMGGAKVSDKIGVIENLLPKVEQLLIGGAMTYTFLRAQGHATGKSRVEADKLDEARRLLKLAGAKLVLPVDHLVATSLDATAETHVVEGPELPDELVRRRHRPEDRRDVRRRDHLGRHGGLERPDGQVRGRAVPPGTLAVAGAMAASPAITVVGGGETAEAVEEFGFAEKVSPRLHRRRGVPRMPRRENLQLAEGDPRSLRE